MQLSQVGEFALIDILKENTINQPDTVVTGIGDDAAVFRASGGHLQLATADMLVEDVHFSLATTTAWQLGYKAMAVNISDIAAMGGKPRQALVSIALPHKLSVEFVVELYEGMKKACREFALNIIGGDTVASPGGLVINVTVLGDAVPAQVVRRSGAAAGDVVAVTGTLGDSAGGLALLLAPQVDRGEFGASLIERHLLPRPQLQAGGYLASAGATSMNDISDGLASEVNEIAAASQVGMRIYKDRIPLSPQLQALGRQLDKEAADYALYGGEDYQLVFTIAAADWAKLQENAAGTMLTVIGEVTPAGTGVVLVDEGQETPLTPQGYNHFR